MGHWGDADCSARVRAKRIIAAAARDAEQGRPWTVARLEGAILEALEAEERRTRGRLGRAALRLLDRIASRLADPALVAGVVLARERLRTGLRLS